MTCTSLTPRQTTFESILLFMYLLGSILVSFLFITRHTLARRAIDRSLIFRGLLTLSLYLRAVYWVILLMSPKLTNNDADALGFVYLKGIPTVLFFGGFCLVIRQWQRAFYSVYNYASSQSSQWGYVDSSFALVFLLAFANEVVASLLGTMHPEDCRFMKMKGTMHCIMFTWAALGFAFCGLYQLRLLHAGGHRFLLSSSPRNSSITSLGSSRRKIEGALVSAVCVTVFTLRAVWTTYRHFGGQWPGTRYMSVLDLCYYTLLELIPTALLIYLLREKTPPPPPPAETTATFATDETGVTMPSSTRDLVDKYRAMLDPANGF